MRKNTGEKRENSGRGISHQMTYSHSFSISIVKKHNRDCHRLAKKLFELREGVIQKLIVQGSEMSLIHLLKHQGLFSQLDPSCSGSHKILRFSIYNVPGRLSIFL